MKMTITQKILANHTGLNEVKAEQLTDLARKLGIFTEGSRIKVDEST